jgi:hypothetical protein
VRKDQQASRETLVPKDLLAQQAQQVAQQVQLV